MSTLFPPVFRMQMNRRDRRAHAASMAQLPTNLTPVSRDRWPLGYDNEHRREVWLSCDFCVQVFDENENIVRLSVNRTGIGPGGRWLGEISWDELQDVKRQIGLGEHYAVEIYPRDQDLVNVANMRHLWVLMEPLPIGWFANSGAAP